MSGHGAYIAWAFGVTFAMVAIELLWLARRRRYSIDGIDREDGR